MIGRTAGNDIDALQSFQHFIGNSGFRQIDGPVLHIGADGILYGFRLLMDLFQHEMLIAALFRCLGIPLDFHHFFLNLFPVDVIEADLISGHLRDLVIADIVDVPCLVKDRRHI